MRTVLWYWVLHIIGSILSGFISGLELLLWPYREKIEIIPEKWLSTQGIRMDVLVLEKDPSVQLDFDIARIFKTHNIIEYKQQSILLCADSGGKAA